MNNNWIAWVIVALAFNGFCYWNYTQKNPQKVVYENKQEHEYQLIQLGNFRRDHFMLDKKTGRVWECICGHEEDKSGECRRMVWREMPILDKKGTSLRRDHEQ